MKYADLHIHTNFSDGTFSPAQIVDLAKKEGLNCISIADHDSLEAYKNLPPQDEIEIISGIELTADINNSEAHILGYFVDCSLPWFQEKLADIRQARIERMFLMCAKLTDLGMIISVDEVLKFAGHSCVGRLHLARLMVKKGFIANTQEAFNRYIGDNGPVYVSKFRLKPAEAIELVIKAKGVAVLAHPYSLPNQDLIPEFIQAGLRGIEAVYPEHTSAQVERYKRLAYKYGICVSGGSDCHGQAKPEVRIGMVKLPYSFVERLKEELNEPRTFSRFNVNKKEGAG